jgi:hypothetical protein
MPIRPFKGADGHLDRFVMAREAHFRLQRIDDDLDDCPSQTPIPTMLKYIYMV